MLEVGIKIKRVQNYLPEFVLGEVLSLAVLKRELSLVCGEKLFPWFPVTYKNLVDLSTETYWVEALVNADCRFRRRVCRALRSGWLGLWVVRNSASMDYKQFENAPLNCAAEQWVWFPSA